MSSFKERCIELRKRDFSLIEIAKITGRNKSSVYWHIASMPLSAERMSRYRRQSAEHIRQFSAARKGKSRRGFKKFGAWSPRLVLLVSHLLFDGEIQRGRCSYNNRSESLLIRIETLMQDLYDFEPKRYANSTTRVVRLAYNNVALEAYLQEKGRDLLTEIELFPLELQREFVRAFFDDEGCVDFRPYSRKKRVRGYQKDVSVLKKVQSVLTSFNISSRVVMPNEVVISGKENLIRFEKEINFSKGVRVNGNRSNSIWKEHLEKRVLLRRAIESFKN